MAKRRPIRGGTRGRCSETSVNTCCAAQGGVAPSRLQPVSRWPPAAIGLCLSVLPAGALTLQLLSAHSHTTCAHKTLSPHHHTHMFPLYLLSIQLFTHNPLPSPLDPPPRANQTHMCPPPPAYLLLAAVQLPQLQLCPCCQPNDAQAGTLYDVEVSNRLLGQDAQHIRTTHLQEQQQVKVQRGR